MTGAAVVRFLRETWRHVTFYYTWPSLLTEALSGAVCVALVAASTAALGFTAALPWVAVAATALSIWYEGVIDPNGWSLGDVAQRTVGVALGVAALALWRTIT